MIIYKLENGRASDFKYSRTLPNGWLSIDGDNIPDDITKYHGQEYLDYLTQRDINNEARKFLDNTDWKMTRHRDQSDKEDDTSLTDAEFQDLLTERQAKRDSITEV